MIWEIIVLNSRDAFVLTSVQAFGKAVRSWGPNKNHDEAVLATLHVRIEEEI